MLCEHHCYNKCDHAHFPCCVEEGVGSKQTISKHGSWLPSLGKALHLVYDQLGGATSYHHRTFLSFVYMLGAIT